VLRLNYGETLSHQKTGGSVIKETNIRRQEKRHEEDRESLRRFRPIDDIFMRGLFKDNLPLAELVLRIITGKQDLVLLKCEIQADMKRSMISTAQMQMTCITD